jgi:REP element-mobilizing transposase RayT
VQFPKSIRLPHEAYANQNAFFHIVVNCLPGTKPFQDRALGAAIWAVIEGEQERTAVQVSASCLMPDHLHLLVSPRTKTVIQWMNDFKSYTTRISKDFRPQRSLWQPSFYDRRIRDEAEFEAAVAYVVRNPVSAGLVDEPELWAWVGSWLDD